jgi:hypothetical protein
MGLVIEFDAHTGARRPRPDRPSPERPCEVTIFPGVRYDRRTAAERLATTVPDRRPLPRPEETAR